MEQKVYNLQQLNELLPFGKSKILKMCQTGALPVTKVGKQYIISVKNFDKWLEENAGKEVFF